ncbi:PREDICTED: uncharacterized protein LOC108611575 [Drosophila arizonae]|uniref:Uncharacterized protein LOC108611575 n=1 Tax=Drosophila arizonae TaxID=7263 RepID=A0ABM1NXU7_DROAR|nr:PREDICTED: uncharacterized protein LOC108611575 [Drosophila arizonae]
MSDPENESKSNKRGPKHMRLRYYTSYEEAMIVKLWREHLHEITSYTENLVIFREIAFGLQQHRIRLNKQEVRRRISSYRNKYLVERSRYESDPQYKSDWRLYQLVDCLFQPAAAAGTTPPITTERKFIEDLEEKIRREVPNLPRFNRHDCRTMKFEMDPNSCPFYEDQASTPQVKAELHQMLDSPKQQIKTELKAEMEHLQPAQSIPTEKRSPLMPANRTLEPQSQPQPSPVSEFSQPSVRRLRRRSIMPRTGQITLAQIERLRKENEMLAEQRDAHLADLALKEREYQQLEQTFDFWLHQQETWMAYLDTRGIK